MPSHEGAEPAVRLDVDGAVATVTLCDADRRNPQSPRLWHHLAELGSNLPAGVRVVVVRAEGPSFSAGLDRSFLNLRSGRGPADSGAQDTAMFTGAGIAGDLSLAGLATGTDGEIQARISGFQEAFSVWRRADVVSVAAVQGHAVGAGFQLALACDLRVCADDVRFSMRETSLGLVPDLGGTRPLVRTVGYARALELCVTGRWVSAAEAEQLGLATVVVPRDALDATVSDLVAALVAPPHRAVTATKAVLQAADDERYDEQLAVERLAQVDLLRALVATRQTP